jgi:hypothetical protein
LLSQLLAETLAATSVHFFDFLQIVDANFDLPDPRIFDLLTALFPATDITSPCAEPSSSVPFEAQGDGTTSDAKENLRKASGTSGTFFPFFESFPLRARLALIGGFKSSSGRTLFSDGVRSSHSSFPTPGVTRDEREFETPDEKENLLSLSTKLGAFGKLRFVHCSFDFDVCPLLLSERRRLDTFETTS